MLSFHVRRPETYAPSFSFLIISHITLDERQSLVALNKLIKETKGDKRGEERRGEGTNHKRGHL